MPKNPSAAPGPATPNRKGRMTKSRAVAAGASVGALVLVTAGIAAANPAKNTSSGAKAGSGTDANRSTVGRGTQGDDSGWSGGGAQSGSGGDVNGDGGSSGFTDDGGGFQQAPSDNFQQAPSDNFQQAPSDNFQQAPSFNPGFGGGSGQSASGGS